MLALFGDCVVVMGDIEVSEMGKRSDNKSNLKK